MLHSSREQYLAAAAAFQDSYPHYCYSTVYASQRQITFTREIAPSFPTIPGFPDIYRFLFYVGRLADNSISLRYRYRRPVRISSNYATDRRASIPFIQHGESAFSISSAHVSGIVVVLCREKGSEIDGRPKVSGGVHVSGLLGVVGSGRGSCFTPTHCLRHSLLPAFVHHPHRNADSATESSTSISLSATAPPAAVPFASEHHGLPATTN